MPLGSSSEAPVMRPGPRSFKNRQRGSLTCRSRSAVTTMPRFLATSAMLSDPRKSPAPAPDVDHPVNSATPYLDPLGRRAPHLRLEQRRVGVAQYAALGKPDRHGGAEIWCALDALLAAVELREQLRPRYCRPRRVLTPIEAVNDLSERLHPPRQVFRRDPDA